MAKKQIFRYTFTPGSAGNGTVKVSGNIRVRELLLITNVTKNSILFNFADTTTPVTAIYDSAINETTFTLGTDTSTMNTTDELSVYVEQSSVKIEPSTTYADPVEKFRVSNPQTLMDTDFEYSLQTTKWESVQLQNNVPGIFQKANEPSFQGSAITSILPYTPPAGAAVTSFAATPNGRTGMTTVFSGNSDDSNFFIPIPFQVTIGSTNYTSCFLGSNGFITFGGGSSQYFNLTPANQPNGLPAIKFSAEDNRIFFGGYRTIGAVGSRVFIIRWEGSWLGQNTPGNKNIEVHFYEGIQQFDVVYESINRTGWNAITDGNSNISTWTPTAGNTYRTAFLSGQAQGGELEITVESAPPQPFFVGQPVIFKETKDTLFLDGSFIIKSVTGSTSFVIQTKAPAPYTEDQKTDYTTIYTGGFFFSSALPYSTVTQVSGTRRVRINFNTPHPLYIGSKIYVVDNTLTSGNWIGSFTVSKVISDTSVEYNADVLENFADNSVLSNLSSTNVYVRNEGVSTHRFADGGVSINPASNSPNSQIIRQTRKYFRYQSGKGIQFSTGVLFRPTYDVLTSSVLTNIYQPSEFEFISMTIETDQIHGFNTPDDFREGALITLEGFTVSSGINIYNGTHRISQIVGPRKFSILIDVSATGLPADTSPGGIGKVVVREWNDATVRTGLFDDQNGLFFEYDGHYLHCVRRNSTEQIAGFIDVANNQALVTGTNTKFISQLKENDYIVIKGVSYIITQIVDDSNLYIAPDYKGASIQNSKIVKTNDLKIRQEEFSIDPLDGTGPSGYNFDANKMQMVFIDYSWYGAGKVRYGMRGLDGTVFYFHEFLNNNNNTEAYMRTGNLPGRFEIQSKSKNGYLKAPLTTTDTELTVSTSDAFYLPTKGRVVVNNEYMTYEKGATTGENTTLNLVTRNEFGLASGTTSASTDNTWVSFNQNVSPTLSHWGVSVIMDGRFDEDKSYLFSAVNTNFRSIINGSLSPLITIRLAPSVDFGIAGFYGIRNLINRSALTLKDVGIRTNGIFTTVVKINCESTLFANNANWLPAGNGSIAQYMDHSIVGGTVTGGDQVASFLGEEGSSRYAAQTFNIDVVRELGNSILGGPNPYPDGPDTLTVFALNQSGATRNAYAQIAWTEAQG